MKRLASAVLFCVVLAVSAAAVALQTPPAGPAAPLPEGARIAFVDLPRVVSGSAVGKASTAKVEALRAKKLAELNTRNKEIEAIQQKLAGTMLSQEARAAAQKSGERLQVEIQRAQQDAEAEMRELQQQLNEEFDRALAPVLAQVATEKRLHALVRLDAGVLAWADPALDLTAEIIKRLDSAGAGR